jgi:hypothetical protein
MNERVFRHLKPLYSLSLLAATGTLQAALDLRLVQWQFPILPDLPRFKPYAEM